MYSAAVTEYKGYPPPSQREPAKLVLGGDVIYETGSSLLEGGWSTLENHALREGLNIDDLFDQMASYNPFTDADDRIYNQFFYPLENLGRVVQADPNFPLTVRSMIRRFTEKVIRRETGYSTSEIIAQLNFLVAVILLIDQKRLLLSSLDPKNPEHEIQRMELQRKIRDIEKNIAPANGPVYPLLIALKKIIHNPSNYTIDSPLKRKLQSIRQDTLQSQDPWTSGLFNILPRVHRNDPFNRRSTVSLPSVNWNTASADENNGDVNMGDDENNGGPGTYLLQGAPRAPRTPRTPLSPFSALTPVGTPTPPPPAPTMAPAAAAAAAASAPQPDYDDLNAYPLD